MKTLSIPCRSLFDSTCARLGYERVFTFAKTGSELSTPIINAVLIEDEFKKKRGIWYENFHKGFLKVPDNFSL